MKLQIINKITIIIFLFTSAVYAQNCETTMTIILENYSGGYFINKQITISELEGNAIFKAKSNYKGKAVFTLPCNTYFNINVSNYSKTKKIKTHNINGVSATRVLKYNADNIQKAKAFKMSDNESKSVNNTANTVSDTVIINTSYMKRPKNIEHFSEVHIMLKNIDEGALKNEKIWLTGEKRGKTIQIVTNSIGKTKVYLLKGDIYSLNFTYNKNYSSIESAYTKGTSKIDLKYTYLGTKEIELRKKIEEIRIAKEEERLFAEEERFKEYCKKHKISIEEGRRRKTEEYIENYNSYKDTVVSTVLNRNKWSEKLIVCDLTGSMSPYSSQLLVWYKLHYLKEKNLQFVFFNDGDQKYDSEKKIGETGGIYYSQSKGIDSLFSFTTKVSANGNGGDCAENNIEALIKGTKMAKPFKELIMIADNNAPVKDIELLKDFNIPVHIILCGCYNQVLSDYLLIAFKTKGSIHTIEQDITKIGKMNEGENILINNITYRIMGGEFVRIPNKKQKPNR